MFDKFPPGLIGPIICESVDKHVLLVLSEHGAGQRVRRRVVDQMKNLLVLVLRININCQNGTKDFLQHKHRVNK